MPYPKNVLQTSVGGWDYFSQAVCIEMGISLVPHTAPAVFLV